MVQIDGAGGRHKILTDGSLQIIGLVRTDSGIYLCIADNGVGPSITKEFRLDVTGEYAVTPTRYRPVR